MTKFNPENKDVLTFGEALGPAMKITDQDDANQYLADYIAYTERQLVKEPRDDDMTAEQIVKINLGYYAGYYNTETRDRVERLFACAHPIFGTVAENGAPSANEALAAGATSARQRQGKRRSFAASETRNEQWRAT